MKRIEALALSLLLAAPAASLTYAPVTDAELVDLAAVIVFGEVVSVREAPRYRYLTVAVDGVLKGSAGSTVVIRQVGGTQWIVPGAPQAVLGDRGVWFLDADGRADPAVGWMGRASRRYVSIDGKARDPELFRAWVGDRVAGRLRPTDYEPVGPVSVAQPYKLLTRRCEGATPILRWRTFPTWSANSMELSGTNGSVGWSDLVASAARWEAASAASLPLSRTEAQVTAVLRVALNAAGLGLGYTDPPTVTFSAPPEGGRQAAGTAVLGQRQRIGQENTELQLGVVDRVDVTDSGDYGLLGEPTVTFSAPVDKGSLSRLQWSHGSGYVEAPTVTVSDAPAGGTTARLVASVLDGKVVGIVPIDRGAGYTSAPTVSIAAPPAGGTQAEVLLVETALRTASAPVEVDPDFDSLPTPTHISDTGIGIRPSLITIGRAWVFCGTAYDAGDLGPATEPGRAYVTLKRNLLDSVSPDDWRQVMTHELGHALGLDHSSDETAIMWARTRSGRGYHLGDDDIAAIRALYGVDENRAPLAVGTLSDLSLRVADGARAVDVSGAFSDPDDDDLTFSATSSNNAAATVATADAVVTVTPLSGGRSTVTVTATDDDGESAKQEFDVTVGNGAPSAIGTLADQNLQVGDGNEVVDVASRFSDPEGDTLTYAASSSAPAVAGASVSGSRVTLSPLARGTATITVTATDLSGSNTAATQLFDVRVKGRRGVTLSTGALSVDEGATNKYTVVLDSEPTGQVTVTPSVPANRNLSVDPSSLMFTTVDWRSAKSVQVKADRDANTTSEPPVAISHVVSGADYGSVSASSVDVTIVEKDASVLSVSATEALEDAGTLTFRVTLSKESSSEITVDYATSDGAGAAGARADSDYTGAYGTLTFPANSTASQEIVVGVLDDPEDEEEEETLRLTLTNARHASLAGGNTTLSVTGTIRDDDDPRVEVSFRSSRYHVTEGRTVNVEVSLDRDPERYLGIFLEVTHHGGAQDADYSGVPPSIQFGPGVTMHQLQVAATDDTFDDDGESVVLSFGQLPERVTGHGGTTIAIGDNDAGDALPPENGDGGPPVASFIAFTDCADGLCHARTGVAVTLEDVSNGSVRSRHWDFGDGRHSGSRRLSHAWASPGFYEVTLRVSDGTIESTHSRTFLVEASKPAGTCVAGRETVCLQDSRYSVSVDWSTADGSGGEARVVRAGTNDAGLFSFFDLDNWEVLIKVLDGCTHNGHVWVFGASTTNLGYLIRVTDTVTGFVKEYRNQSGAPANAITDTRAFPDGCRP